jgi:hypothetical protein
VCAEPLNSDNDNGSGDGFDDCGFGGLGDCCRYDCIGAYASNSFVNCCGDFSDYCSGHDFCACGNNAIDDYGVVVRVIIMVFVFNGCGD